MAGARQQVRGNCLRNNGQYGMNAYQAENGIVDLVVEGNEIDGNNTEDWEAKAPGCGCTGGVQFWSVDGADIRNNWVHDNHGAGLWGDTNNNDFLIEENYIEDNDAEAGWTQMVILASVGRSFSVAEWQADPYRQDAGAPPRPTSPARRVDEDHPEHRSEHSR